MKIKDSAYRKVAKALVTEISPRHPAYANQRRKVAYTRTPAGAWVNMWVWVPKEYAIMEQTKGATANED